MLYIFEILEEKSDAKWRKIKRYLMKISVKQFSDTERDDFKEIRKEMQRGLGDN